MKLLLFLFFLGIAIANASSPSSSSSPSVIIVGAGMSGISAAKRLSDAGIKDFIILEATDRIGGRIKKTNFAGYTVEVGANWLHGVGGPLKNPLYEMAKQINLRRFYSDWDSIYTNTYKQEGGKYDESEVEAAYNKTLSVEENGAEMTEALKKKKIDDDMSIYSFERLNGTVPQTLLEKALDFFEFDGEEAQSTRVTSLKHSVPYAEGADFGGDSFFVADSRGFESLVHLVAKPFLSYDQNNNVNDARVKFNQVVREVKQTRYGVTIKTEDGKVYHSKLAILSPSLGVLQSGLITFKPQLPLWKRRAIAEFDMGIYTKIFLKFPTTFWPTGNGTEFFLYAHERRGYFSYWQHLDNEYPGSNVIFVTVTDEESIRIEKQSDEETKAEAMAVLRKMFGKDIPEPTDILIPRWYSNRFFRGTFSNWPIGYPEKRHEQLAAPVGRIHFTGEHTHPKYYGYADGALLAGANTAKDVIAHLTSEISKGALNS